MSYKGKFAFLVVSLHGCIRACAGRSQALDTQFASGRLYACIASRPGQCGRCDGYILEGKELEFYQRKLLKKKGK